MQFLARFLLRRALCLLGPGDLGLDVVDRSPQHDAVVKDLKPIYTAIDSDHALLALEAFEEKWGQQLPVIGQAWRSSWEYVTPFLTFEPEVRRVIYTTDEGVKAPGRDLRGAISWV